MIVVGLVVGLVIRNKVHNGLLNRSRVCGTGDANFDDWRSNTGSDAAEKYKLYYGFNSTNVVQYLTQTPAAPVNLTLDVVGPYAMRQYDSLYNISFSNDNKLVTYKTWSKFVFTKSKSCDDCTQIDRFNGLNPVLLGSMTKGGSELLIGLAVSAADLYYPLHGQNQCTKAAIAYSLQNDCEPRNPNNTNCCCDRKDNTTKAGCMARARQLYSQYAEFDNGIQIGFGAQPLFSPLFLNKNVHEFAYGYPSALLGLLVASGLNSSKVEDRVTLAKMAQYTELAQQACNYSGAGLAPPVESLAGRPYQHLGLITCSPINATRYWAETIPGVGPRCAIVNSTIGCKCAIPTHGVNGLSTPEKPCCTVLGLGCLAKVVGYVSDEMYLSQDQSYLDYTADNTTQNTGCGDFEDESEFWWSGYEGAKAKFVWSSASAAYTSPTQPQFTNATTNPQFFQNYMAPVRGSDGTRSKGRGKTTKSFSKKLTDGKPKYDSRTVYITQVYRSTQVFSQGTTEFQGIPVTKFSPPKGFLNQNTTAAPDTVDNSMVGAATPFAGVQDITYTTGFPAFVSRPLFMYGDSDALHQTAGCKTNPSISCSGINVMIDGEEAEADPNVYETYLNVEPSTGLTFEGHKRLMASFGLWKCVSPTQGCTPAYGIGLANLLSPYVPGGKVIPQYWMDETSQATDDQVSTFKKLENVSYSADVVLLVLVLFGGLFLVAGVVLLVLSNKRKPASTTESLMSNIN